MASETAKRLATEIEEAYATHECSHVELVDWVTSKIDAAIREGIRPLVDAVLAAAIEANKDRPVLLPTILQWLKMVVEARKLEAKS